MRRIKIPAIIIFVFLLILAITIKYHSEERYIYR